MRIEVTRRIEIDLGFYCENIEYMRIEVTRRIEIDIGFY
jgi:hypothetical protein